MNSFLKKSGYRVLTFKTSEGQFHVSFGVSLSTTKEGGQNREPLLLRNPTHLGIILMQGSKYHFCHVYHIKLISEGKQDSVVSQQKCLLCSCQLVLLSIILCTVYYHVKSYLVPWLFLLFWAQHAYAQFNSFYRPINQDVAPRKKRYQVLPTFPYYKRQKAGWGLRTRLCDPYCSKI